MKFLAFLTAVSLALILFGPSPVSPQSGASTAQGPMEQQMSEKAMQDMMMKYGMPAKQHEFLKKFVGDWTMEIESRTGNTSSSSSWSCPKARTSRRWNSSPRSR